MRYVLTTLMILTSLIATGSSVSAEVMCAEPAASAGTAVTEGTPVATPFTATEFPESGGELTIFAAASLTDAYAEMAENLEAAHPGLTITVETAGSQSLVTQLEEGATADVLATANTSTMTRAQESGLISGDPVTFTASVPSATRICCSRPSSTASTSMVALSVSISAITMPDDI